MPETDAEKRKRETELLAEIEQKRREALERINSLQPANIGNTVKDAKRSSVRLLTSLRDGFPLKPEGNRKNLLDHLKKSKEKISDCLLTEKDYIHEQDLEILSKNIGSLLELEAIKADNELKSELEQTKQLIEKYQTIFRKAE